MKSLPDAKQLRVIMAGDGNPFAALSARRRQALFLARQGHSFEDIAQLLDIKPGELRDDLDVLQDYSLVADVKDAPGHVAPTFLIADARQVPQVIALANELADELAQSLLDHWKDLDDAFPDLHVASTHSFEESAFLLVGDLILDIGLLSALAKDATLMPKAPRRPSPDRPDARYYFWMIEGKPENLGRYGQRVSTLPWKSWLHITYGQYWIDGRINEARETHDAAAEQALASVNSAAELAHRLNIPLLDKADVTRWGEVTRPHMQRLVDVYLSAEPKLRQCFDALLAGRTTGGVFAEFFCWFDHLAYGHAIDILDRKGVLRIPSDRFAAAIVHDSASHF